MRAFFVRKAKSIDDLQVIGKGESCKYTIDQVVELTPIEYEEFSKNLLANHPFILSNKTFMRIGEDRLWHCLLVNVPGRTDGILIQSNGYTYARYAAYWKFRLVENMLIGRIAG